MVGVEGLGVGLEGGGRGGKLDCLGVRLAFKGAALSRKHLVYGAKKISNGDGRRGMARVGEGRDLEGLGEGGLGLMVGMSKGKEMVKRFALTA